MNSHHHSWVSCTKFTVLVVEDDTGKIVEAAPIVVRFVGQPIENLLTWICRNGWGPLWTQSIDPPIQLPPNRWRPRPH